MLLHGNKLNKKVSVCSDLTNTYFIDKKEHIVIDFNLFESIDQVIIVLFDAISFVISVLVNLLNIKLPKLVGVKHIGHIWNTSINHVLQFVKKALLYSKVDISGLISNIHDKYFGPFNISGGICWILSEALVHFILDLQDIIETLFCNIAKPLQLILIWVLSGFVLKYFIIAKVWSSEIRGISIDLIALLHCPWFSHIWSLTHT